MTAFKWVNGSHVWQFQDGRWSLFYGPISSNSVPIRHSDEFETEKLNAIKQVTAERDLLMASISIAAYKAGIYNGEVELSISHLLVLLEDMSSPV